jgi:hypothetical protein
MKSSAKSATVAQQKRHLAQLDVVGCWWGERPREPLHELFSAPNQIKNPPFEWPVFNPLNQSFA